jgi:hypothetical protein
MLTADRVSAQPPTPTPEPPIGDPSANDFVLNNRDLVIRDGANRVRIRADAQTGDIWIFGANGEAAARIEENGSNMWLVDGGDLVLLGPGVTDQDLTNARVHIDGDTGTQSLGGAGRNGQLVLRDSAGRQRVLVSAQMADLILGQEGAAGDVFVRNSEGEPMVTLRGASGQVTAGDVFVRNSEGENMVTLSGASGRVAAGQMVSAHSASGSEGIDTASVYLESGNPAIGLRDNTGGNSQGWMIEANNAGSLSFSAGTTNGLNEQVFVLQPDGGVCIGSCN